MANNPYVNKVIKGSTTIIEISGDTVAADKMLSGYTAHSASGAPVTGNVTFSTVTVSSSNPTGGSNGDIWLKTV